jgi:hypothetical protein
LEDKGIFLEDNIETSSKEVHVDWIHLTQGTVQEQLLYTR